MMSAYLYVCISAEVGAGAVFALSRSRAQSQKKIAKARRKKSAKNSMDTTLHLSTTPLSKLANKFLCQQSNLETQMIIIYRLPGWSGSKDFQCVTFQNIEMTRDYLNGKIR
jgi:hypothetical protein